MNAYIRKKAAEREREETHMGNLHIHQPKLRLEDCSGAGFVGELSGGGDSE